MGYFIFVFTFMIIGIGILYRVLGAKIDESNFEGLNIYFMYGMFSFENALGWINNPELDFWQNQNRNKFIETGIWFIWFFNQLLLLIIMMNFLISLVTTVFQDVMSKKLEIEYELKCKLNREA